MYGATGRGLGPAAGLAMAKPTRALLRGSKLEPSCFGTVPRVLWFADKTDEMRFMRNLLKAEVFTTAIHRGKWRTVSWSATALPKVRDLDSPALEY